MSINKFETRQKFERQTSVQKQRESVMNKLQYINEKKNVLRLVSLQTIVQNAATGFSQISSEKKIRLIAETETRKKKYNQYIYIYIYIYIYLFIYLLKTAVQETSLSQISEIRLTYSKLQSSKMKKN